MGNPVGPPRGGTPVLPIPGQPAPLRPDEFGGAAHPNFVSFGFNSISPPSTVYIQRDDVLQIIITASAIGALTAVATTRVLLPVTATPMQPDEAGKRTPASMFTTGGQIITSQENFSFAAAASFTRNIPLTEGYLLSVAISSPGNISRGTIFAVAKLIRNTAAGAQAVQILFSDYLSFNGGIGFPGGRQISASESTGNLKSVTGSAPAAGADFVLAVPAFLRWRVVGVFATLVTSAAAANRIPRIRLDDGAVVYHQGTPNQVVPASTNANVSGNTATQAAVAGDPAVMVPFPSGLILPPAHRILSNTLNIQAGDQWSAATALVEEYIFG